MALLMMPVELRSILSSKNSFVRITNAAISTLRSPRYPQATVRVKIIKDLKDPKVLKVLNDEW